MMLRAELPVQRNKTLKVLWRHATVTAVGGNPACWTSIAGRRLREAARAGYRGVPPAVGPC